MNECFWILSSWLDVDYQIFHKEPFQGTSRKKLRKLISNHKNTNELHGLLADIIHIFIFGIRKQKKMLFISYTSKVLTEVNF